MVFRRVLVRCLAGADAATNAACAEDYVQVLGHIHAIDVDAVGLGVMAKREGHLERQVVRWTDQWERSKDADAPEVDELAARLAAAKPVQAETTLVHGD